MKVVSRGIVTVPVEVSVGARDGAARETLMPNGVSTCRRTIRHRHLFELEKLPSHAVRAY